MGNTDHLRGLPGTSDKTIASAEAPTCGSGSVPLNVSAPDSHTVEVLDLGRYGGQIDEVIRTDGAALKSAISTVARRVHDEHPSVPVKLLEIGLLYHYMHDRTAEINEIGRGLVDGFEVYKKHQGASAARAQRAIGELLGISREGARFLFRRPRAKI